MVDYLGFYFLLNFVGGLIVMYASIERAVSIWFVLIASVLLTPIGGFLFALCYPTNVELDSKKRLEIIIDKLEIIAKEKQKEN